MQPDQLAAIKARTDAATPGPWRAADHGCGCVYAADDVVFEHGEHSYGRSAYDANFAAKAREDVPALLARVAELEADRDGWKQAARVYATSRDASDHRADKARAEVERLREVIAGFDEDHAAAFRRGQMRAAAEVARLRAQVAAVEALADFWEQNTDPYMAARLRAAARAEHPGEATS